mmetsp:Transcript_5375/g.6416  ORF Transcript_5375/g.6416 Transcript_5375/m.6416 type:complete len:84 (-) Transcript_5375:1456-1707(-)
MSFPNKITDIQKETGFVMNNTMQRLDLMEKTILIISDRSKEDSSIVQEMKFVLESSEQNNKTWTTEKIEELRRELHSFQASSQ